MKGSSLTTTKQTSVMKVESNPENDLYMKMKDLESQLEMLQIQEDYLKDEQRHLKSEYVRSKEEVSFFDPEVLTKFLIFQIDQENSVGPLGNWKLR